MITGNVESLNPPTPEESCSLLSRMNVDHGIHVDYDLALEFMYYYNSTADYLDRRLSKYLGLRSEMTSADVIKQIIRDKGIARYFPMTKTGEISLDSKGLDGILEGDYVDRELKWILKNYKEIKTRRVLINQFAMMFSVGIPCQELSWNNHRMLKIIPVWAIQNTGRFATTEPALHNFAGQVKDVITVPKGYVLFAVDSGQIDPRLTFSFKMPDKQIQYFINLHNDAYLGILQYILLPAADIASGRTDIPKMEITDEIMAMRKQLKTYINAVIYNSDNDEGNRIKRLLIDRIGKHPMHVKWVNEVQEQMYQGKYVVETAFGYKVDVRDSQNSQGKYGSASEGSYQNHLLRSAINAPIQGTAADLHRLAIQDEYLYLLRKDSKSYIVTSIHDAIYTAVAEDTFDEEKEYLSHVPEYKIDGWVPIYSSAEVGQHRENKTFVGDRY